MGIQGLTTFVERNFNSWKRAEVKGKVIVDGYSLLFSLETTDWTHGGQYPEFRRKLGKFFENLKNSHIDPIVVMDGIDVEGQKTPLIVKRRREAIKMVDRCCRRERREFATGCGVLLSQSVPVFIMLLKEMKVDVVFADGEGDVTIYEMANGYSCPVLSNDSDFFVYNIPDGYIPFNRFYWDKGTPITADVYYFENFCKEFKISDVGLRLIFAAIAGNDFISPMSSIDFTEHIYQASQEELIPGKKISMSVIMNFIQTFPSLSDFREGIMQISDLPQHTKEKLLRNTECAEQMYNSGKSSTLETLKKSTSLRVRGMAEMPIWILRQFRNGSFFIMHSLTTGKTLVDTYIDDTAMPTSTDTSKCIRQCLYGLTGWKDVTEIYRLRLNIAEEKVQAVTEIQGFKLPELGDIHTLKLSDREHLVYLVLGCSDCEAMLNNLESMWHLVIASTRFWARKCSPSLVKVEMLVLCFVTVCYSVQLQVDNGILYHFRRTEQWMETLHLFAKWLSCYGDASKLNQFLMLPLKQVSPADLFDGKLLMFLIGRGPDETTRSNVLRNPSHSKLYEQLMKAVCWPQDWKYDSEQYMRDLPSSSRYDRSTNVHDRRSLPLASSPQSWHDQGWDSRQHQDDQRRYHHGNQSFHGDPRNDHRSYHGDQRSYHGDQRSYHGDQRSYHGDQRSYHGDQRSYHDYQRSYYSDERSYHGDQRNYHGDQNHSYGEQRRYHEAPPQRYQEDGYYTGRSDNRGERDDTRYGQYSRQRESYRDYSRSGNPNWRS